MLRSPADVRTVCSDLVRRALDAGGHDNVSVVVVEAVEVVGQTPASENTAGNGAIAADSADAEAGEGTLPRGIAEDGRGRWARGATPWTRRCSGAGLGPSRAPRRWCCGRAHGWSSGPVCADR